MIQKRKMNKINIKNAFEYFNAMMNKPGTNPGYSIFVWNNYNRLAGAYQAIANEIYDENRDPEVQAYNGKVAELAKKYAKTNEEGQIVTDSKTNAPVIDEKKAAEFNKKLEELNKENEALLNGVREKKAKNGEIFQQVVELDIDALTISQFINEAPPMIVGLFSYGAV